MASHIKIGVFIPNEAQTLDVATVDILGTMSREYLGVLPFLPANVSAMRIRAAIQGLKRLFAEWAALIIRWCCGNLSNGLYGAMQDAREDEPDRLDGAAAVLMTVMLVLSIATLAVVAVLSL